jgi:large subunit ribosomal protein L23
MNRRHDVLVKPLITEKSTFAKETHHTLTFKVARKATKLEIKDAVEKLLKVKVASVRTAQFHGKLRRQGRYVGHRSDWKKALVTLKKDEKMIEYSEVV